MKLRGTLRPPLLRWLRTALAAAFWLCVYPAWAQKPVAAQGFDGFKMVRSRNIFDPDRRPPSSQNGGSAGASAVPIAPSDYVALTGTMVTANKTLAFFSGSRADFEQVLGPKAIIAGSTITKISPGSVTIERAGKAATIAVGWTLPFNGAASAPAPVPTAAVPSAFTTPGGGAPAAFAASANPPPGAAAPPGTSTPVATPNADVARMMRERRQHEVQ